MYRMKIRGSGMFEKLLFNIGRDSYAAKRIPRLEKRSA